MSNEALPDATPFARLLSWLGRRFQFIVVVAALVVIAVMTVVFVAGGDVTDVEYLREGGYLGVFLLSFLGSVAMVLPVPGLIALCAGGGLGLSPAILGVLAGTGETIGEISGYAVGYGGRGVVEGHWFHDLMESIIRRKPLLIVLFVIFFPLFPALLVLYKFSDRLEQWMERRGAVVLFVVSIIPNPVFDLVGIEGGGARRLASGAAGRSALSGAQVLRHRLRRQDPEGGYGGLHVLLWCRADAVGRLASGAAGRSALTTLVGIPPSLRQAQDRL